jgi:hypothetical protein
MRKGFTLILIFCLLAPRLFSQPRFENDTSSYNHYSNIVIGKIDTSFKLEKENDFEFRLSILPARSRYHCLFILSLKNGIWGTRLFEYEFKPSQQTFTISDVQEKTIRSTEIEKLLNQLNENHYLSIPDEKTLVDKEGKPTLNQTARDGIVHYFELINAKSRRSYYYDCPSSNAKKYEYIDAYRQVKNIINAIFTYCRISKQFRC